LEGTTHETAQLVKRARLRRVQFPSHGRGEIEFAATDAGAWDAFAV
jgi:hypothetical protein